MPRALTLLLVFIATALSGCAAMPDERRATFGLRPGEMFTVLLIAGPGVPHERRSSPVRSVDLGPTILELLGRPVPADIDGRSLLGR